MEILDGSHPQAIAKAVLLLSQGDVVAFPTETVYGLGADAFNPLAVARVFEAKKRPRFDPLIVHIGDKGVLQGLAAEVPDAIAALVERFWPGPLTVIVTKRPVIPDIVTAGLGTVAIRMPSHPVALSLIRSFGRPVAAPSANPFGYLSPTTAHHVARMLKGEVPLVLDGGPCAFGVESTIVSWGNGHVVVHRHGGVSVEELEGVVGPVREAAEKTGTAPREAPGRLPFHYAPHKPVVIIDSPAMALNPNASLLAFRTPDVTPPPRHLRVLSPSGDMREAAANFFSFLWELDRPDVDLIYAERIPETGLGRAMMERLSRAAAKHRRRGG
jgi:L-threonylcarbamoyladenylate synthase